MRNFNKIFFKVHAKFLPKQNIWLTLRQQFEEEKFLIKDQLRIRKNYLFKPSYIISLKKHLF